MAKGMSKRAAQRVILEAVCDVVENYPEDLAHLVGFGADGPCVAGLLTLANALGALGAERAEHEVMREYERKQGR